MALEATLEALDLPELLAMLAGQAATDLGRARLLALRPLPDGAALERRRRRYTEAAALLGIPDGVSQVALLPEDHGVNQRKADQRQEQQEQVLEQYRVGDAHQEVGEEVGVAGDAVDPVLHQLGDNIDLPEYGDEADGFGRFDRISSSIRCSVGEAEHIRCIRRQWPGGHDDQR